LTKLEELASLRQELKRREARRKLLTYYPETGALRRELYPKHISFFDAGITHRERLMLAANRVGKTEGVGGYEMALHLTGDYPEWWKGRRFAKPISAWAAGDTSNTVRDIIQQKLLGPIGHWGTGLIPGDSIDRIVRKAGGVPDSVDSLFVRHRGGGLSRLVLKSYDQRRESFQGTEQDVIWLDEEPPLDIYTECLLRTMTNNGIIMLTFTPLLGLSEVVLSFLPGGKLADRPQDSTKFVVMATWDDAPHLTEQAKKELWDSIPPYQRDARSKGVPQLGSGAIYPIPESEITVQPFPIPDHWPRGFGMDTDQGIGWTAAVWVAKDPESGTKYIYDCYKRSRSELAVHVEAIKSRGAWIPGVADAAALRVTEHDAEQLISLYRKAGLDVSLPDKSVEAGLYIVWTDLSTGKLKVFSSCSPWFDEYRIYRRDERGQVVKANDHLMDATRYFEKSGRSKVFPVPPKPQVEYAYAGGMAQSWMGG
jgi:phage terminase large subunit-like protein